MPKFNVSVPHQLTREDANKLIDRFIEEVLLTKFKDSIGEMEHSREGDALVFKLKTFGIQLTGKAFATDSEFVVDGDLPFTAMMFKGKIESSIREQLERLAKFGIGPKK